jgi:hypothetical protein
MITMTDLRAGDVMLYKPTGLFGALIKFHTGSPDAAHVEVYMGNSQSLASRDRLGVGLYPWRNTELTYVLRPATFNAPSALAWYERDGKGLPYGWWDLGQFCGYNVDGPGIVCSPCATLVLRAGGVPIFRTYPAVKVEPRDFLLSELLTPVWTAKVPTERAA